ncbi:hypothetical protein SAMN04488694_1033 [Natrinema hispanicum]|uniref:Uncharacterized protein n=1 Tax=Natrinema hispanicum TaxID=392421 RepID=A0A1I0AWG9_9EURY|nr:hypothetical protein SAMN04488694_1033 [Natrinema hispanicum]
MTAGDEMRIDQDVIDGISTLGNRTRLDPRS